MRLADRIGLRLVLGLVLGTAATLVTFGFLFVAHLPWLSPENQPGAALVFSVIVGFVVLANVTMN